MTSGSAIDTELSDAERAARLAARLQAERRSRIRARLWIVAMFVGFAALMLGIGWAMTRPSPEAKDFESHNPGWELTERPALFATERASGARVFLPPQALGPNVIERRPCADATATLPSWWRSPPPLADDEVAMACAHVTGPGEDIWVLNVRTGLEIPQVWDGFYGPLAEANGLAASGGWGSGSPGQINAQGFVPRESIDRAPVPREEPVERISRSGGWTVKLPPASQGELELHVEAFYYGRATMVVASVQPPLR